MSPEDLASKWGCAKGHLYRIFRGETALNIEGLERFAVIFGKPRSYFLPPEEQPPSRSASEIISELGQKIREMEAKGKPQGIAEPMPVKMVPFFSQGLSLGPDGKLAIENLEVADYVPIPEKDWKLSLKAARAHGDCLTGKIENGDTVVFDPDMTPTNGRYIICSHRKSEADEWETGVKRFRQVGDAAFLEDNLRTYTLKDCRIIGVVIKITRDV